MINPERLNRYMQAVLDIGAQKITCLIGTYDSFSKKLLIKSFFKLPLEVCQKERSLVLMILRRQF